MERESDDFRSESVREDPPSELATAIERLEQLPTEELGAQLADDQPGESSASQQRLRAAWASAQVEEQAATSAGKPGAAGVLNRAGRGLGLAVQSAGAWLSTKGNHRIASSAPTAESSARTVTQPPPEESGSGPAPLSEASTPSPSEDSGSGPAPPGGASTPSRLADFLRKASAETARGPAHTYGPETDHGAEKREVSSRKPTVHWNRAAAATLGVMPNATAEQVRTAYLRLARLYHPDMATGASTAFRISGNERMKEINAAYNKLMGREADP